MLDYNFSKRLTPPYLLCIHFKPELKWLSAYLFQISDRRCYEWIKEGINDVVCKDLYFLKIDIATIFNPAKLLQFYINSNQDGKIRILEYAKFISELYASTQ